MSQQIAGTDQQRSSRQNNEQRAVLARAWSKACWPSTTEERVISVNKASGQLLGIDQTQAQGRSLQEVVRNADLRRFVSRALRCHEPIDDDVVFHGEQEGVLQGPRSTPCTTPPGRGIGAVVVLNDVTRFSRALEHDPPRFRGQCLARVEDAGHLDQGFCRNLARRGDCRSSGCPAVFADHRQAGRSTRRHHRGSAQPVENRTRRRAGDIDLSHAAG